MMEEAVVKRYSIPFAPPCGDVVSATCSKEASQLNRRKQNVFPRSPLRYPGGKSRALKKIIDAYIPLDLKRLCSPFMGGGSIEIALASSGVKVFAYDIFEPLTAFWQTLLQDPEGLAQRVEKYHALTKQEFYGLQRTILGTADKAARAAILFVLNRSSFSGTILSGGVSPGHPRFTASSVQRLRDFHTGNLTVEHADFTQSLKRHKKDFLYLDPPYANGQKLYGNKGDSHKDFDHIGLANILNKRGRWVLSYNDCSLVRELYKGCHISTAEWSYGMGNGKQSNELIIRPA